MGILDAAKEAYGGIDWMDAARRGNTLGVVPSADNEQTGQDLLALGRGLTAGGSYMLPGGGFTEYAGLAPSMVRNSGYAPGFTETDNWLDKGLLTLGAAGDAAYLIPGIGMVAGAALKAPNALRRGWKAAQTVGGSLAPAAAAEELAKIHARIEDALTDIDVPEITIARPAEVDVDPRIKTTGKYRGAPANVTSPQKLGAMRSNLRQSLERGVIGKNWYQNSSDTARLLTGGRPGYRKAYTTSTALTSQGARVATNLPFGVKGYNQLITEAPDINTGRFPQAVAKQLNRMRAGDNIELGRKVGPFYEALNVSPGVAASRPTNDIWMARAFDYRTPEGGVWDGALGEAQHRFVDTEMENLTQWANQNKVGGYDDWTPEQVQASIWVDTKARAENTSVEEAARDFSDGLSNVTANINVESVPAAGLDHLSGVVDDVNLGRLLASRQRAAFRNEEGQDVIALQTGALTRPSIDGSGYWKDRTDPAEAIPILVGTETGSSVMDPASMELASGIAATRGLLGAQEGVGLNFVKAGGSVAERNAGILDLGGPPTSEQMIEVGQKLDEVFDGNVIPVHTGEGLNYLAFWGDEGSEGSLRAWGSKNNIDLSGAADEVEKRLATEWQKRLTEISKDTFGQKPTYGIKTSKVVGSFDGYKPSAYLEEIERLNPQTRAALDSEPIRLAARELENIDMGLIKEFPKAGQRSQIVQTTRQALMEGGFARVRELVDAGVLPAVMVGLVGAGLAASLSSPQANGQTSAPLLPKGRGDLYY